MESQGSRLSSSPAPFLLDSDIDQFLARDPEETDSSPSGDELDFDISEASSGPGDECPWGPYPELSFYEGLSERGGVGAVGHHVDSGDSFTVRRWGRRTRNSRVDESAGDAVVPCMPESAINCNKTIDDSDRRVVDEHEDIPNQQTVQEEDAPTEHDWDSDISEGSSEPGDECPWGSYSETSFYEVLSEGGGVGAVRHHVESGDSLTVRRCGRRARNSRVDESAGDAVVPCMPESAFNCNKTIDDSDRRVVDKHEDIPNQETVQGQDAPTEQTVDGEDVVREQAVNGQHGNEQIVQAEDVPNETIVNILVVLNGQLMYVQVGALNEQIVHIQEDSDSEQIVDVEGLEDGQVVSVEDLQDEQVVYIQEDSDSDQIVNVESVEDEQVVYIQEEVGNDQVLLAQEVWPDDQDVDNDPFQLNQMDGDDFYDDRDYNEADDDLSDYELPSEDSGCLDFEPGDHNYAAY